MPSETVQLVTWVGQIVLLFGVFIGVPIAFMTWTGKYVAGVFITWGLMIVVYGLLSFGPIFLGFYRDYPDWAASEFPETIVVTACLFLGWFPGLLFALAALLIRGIHAFVVRRRER